MDSPLSLVLPLISALLYVIGALLMRRAADFGVGFWRTAFVANVICAVLFLPLLLLGGHFEWRMLWQPAIVALLFTVGSVLNFISLDRGDVSLATPILGVKIVLVALLTTALVGQTVTPRLWAAAVLSTLAIGLLNWTRGAHYHHVGTTIAAAGSSAAAFALFDVLVQKWSPGWGIGRFPPIMLAFVGLFALLFIAKFPGPLWQVALPAWPWLLAGSVVLACQAMLFVSAVGYFGNATAANVMYSSRGLWSVLAVWLIGHWFSNSEQRLGRGILRWRLIGAGLIMAAILLVLV